ncbi:MAG: hypothetical protein IJA87_02410 [Clostridia bacterium]|nr:hypothetical protein [Clostridia bacterium]
MAGNATALAGGSTAEAGSNNSAGSTSGSANTVSSIAGWIKEINPLYGDPFFPQSSVNCGSCAFAVERRLSGDNTAVASLNNIGTDVGMEQATGKKCVYMSVDKIGECLRSKGAGSHLIVGINRRLPNGQPVAGHWFNAFFDGENIYTIEGQSGEILDWPHDYGHISEWCALV